MFRPIEAIIRFCPIELLKRSIYNSVRNCVSTVRSQHLLRVGLVYLNLNPGHRGSNQLDIVRRIAGGYDPTSNCCVVDCITLPILSCIHNGDDAS
jgi:hypothetical protein